MEKRSLWHTCRLWWRIDFVTEITFFSPFQPLLNTELLLVLLTFCRKSCQVICYNKWLNSATSVYALHWGLVGDVRFGTLVTKEFKKVVTPVDVQYQTELFSQSLLKMYILKTGCIIIQACKSLALYIVDYEKTQKVIRLIVPFQKWPPEVTNSCIGLFFFLIKQDASFSGSQAE